MLREMPGPYDEDVAALFVGGKAYALSTYRARLDRLRRNYYGEIIPRAVAVRRNLRMLGSVRLDPSRLR